MTDSERIERLEQDGAELKKVVREVWHLAEKRTTVRPDEPGWDRTFWDHLTWTLDRWRNLPK